MFILLANPRIKVAFSSLLRIFALNVFDKGPTIVGPVVDHDYERISGTLTALESYTYPTPDTECKWQNNIAY